MQWTTKMLPAQRGLMVGSVAPRHQVGLAFLPQKHPEPSSGG